MGLLRSTRDDERRTTNDQQPTINDQYRTPSSFVVGRSSEAVLDLLALALLALLTVIFYRQLLFQPGTWMPAGGGDLAGFLYPTYRFAAESLRRGEIPLWNPYLYGGAPHVADIQSGVFYPVNLLVFFAFPRLTYRLMELLAVFHVFLAGASMYLCLRFLPISDGGWRIADSVFHSEHQSAIRRSACLVGAIAFMFSDFFVIHFGNLNLIAVTAWLPLAFLGAYRALTDRSLGWALLGATALGMAALAGHAQPLQFILLTIALLALHSLISSLQSPISSPRPSWRRTLRSLSLVAVVVVVGLGLAALSLLPAVEMVQYTRRAALSYAEAARYSLPPLALIGFLVPDLFGRGVEGFWGPWPRVEVGYLGVLPLLLTAVALVLRWHDRRVRFFALLGALSLLLALGEHTPLHRLAYELVPGFRNLRAPARFIVLADFALAALAAFGLDALQRTPPALLRRWAWRIVWVAPLVAGATALFSAWVLWRFTPAPERVTVAVRGLAIFVGLLAAATLLIVARAHSRLGPRHTGVLAVTLVALDLILLGSGVEVGYRDPTTNFRHPRIVEFLRRDPSLYRIEVRPEAWGWWSPNAALLHGLYDTGGIYNPLRLSDYQLFWESLTDRATRLYDFLNAKYVIAPRDFALPWDKFAPVLEDGELAVFLNRRALPRALFVYEVRVAEDQTGAFQAVHAPDFDPSRSVVLERPQLDGVPLPQSTPEAPPQLHVVGFGLNALTLDVTTAAPGVLVLSEVWYPGWKAEVDGRPAPVLRANFAFRAVPVPAGTHRVRLIFAPWSWRVGVMVSLATVLGLLATATGLLARRLGRRRMRRGAVTGSAISIMLLLPVLVIASGMPPEEQPRSPAVRPVPDGTPASGGPQPSTPVVYLPLSLHPVRERRVQIPLLLRRTAPPTPRVASSPQVLAATEAQCQGLVVRDGDHLSLDGRRYTFVGTNVSYLAKDTLPEAQMAPTIRALAAKGVDVIRVWTQPDVDLDRVARMLDLGRKYGVRFVLVLDDYYFDKSESWFDSTHGMVYQPHLRRIVSRFRDHPAVLMWELMNEPNCSAEGQRKSCLDALYRWAKQSVAAIRAIDPCRPISLGTIWIGGYNPVEETQFERLHRIDGVDIISVHKPATAWYWREVRLAETLEMPIFFGEIHQQAYDEGCRPLPGKVEERAQIIEADLKRAAEAGVDGYLLWQFAHDPIQHPNGDVTYYCGTLDYFLDDPAWDVLARSPLKFHPERP